MSKYESAESHQLYCCLTLRLCLGCGVVSLTDQILMEQIQWTGWEGLIERFTHKNHSRSFCGRKQWIAVNNLNADEAVVRDVLDPWLGGKV